MNGVTGLSLDSAGAYTDLAVITAFQTNGMIEARNGSAYAAVNPIPYTANTPYHFRVVVNPQARTYSAYVTPQGG
ncbi:MAG TPA: fibronectin type III domain-containing protein, partial [Candidatus Tectomicrobia bacterium]|nr:fibronectin type III domain-containing protein [Candidatus Tectomicrobia bacterium]